MVPAMNTRKYPRSMSEAFGPYTSHQLSPIPDRRTVEDIALLVVSVIGLVAIVVTSFIR